MNQSSCATAPRLDFSRAIPGFTLSTDDEPLFRLNPRDLNFYEIRGTRAQIEAEHLLPSSADFPEGFAETEWTSGDVRFRLFRLKPPGAKGRRTLFSEADYWVLRGEKKHPIDYKAHAIALKKQALDREIHRHSAEGIVEVRRLILGVEKAQADASFQQFKTLVTGLSKNRTVKQGVSA